jgi:multidrug transporter EmrE-like cation transporter
MNRPVSFDATLTNKRAAHTDADRPYAIWALIVVLVAVACTVLVFDASITPDQRIALFEQSGLFP